MADGSAIAGLPASNRGVGTFRKPGDYPTKKYKGAKRLQESPAIDPRAAISVGIDWLSASVDLRAVLAEQGWDCDLGAELDQLDGDGDNAMCVASAVFAFFFAGTGLVLGDTVGKARFYTHKVPILTREGEFCGQIEFGGETTVRKRDHVYTARIELTGTGCRHFTEEGAAGSAHAKRWVELRAKLESCAGRLTRIDVCADDLLGQFPIRVAQQWWENGEFDRRGQRPKAALHDDFDSGDGKTLNIGSRQSEQFLRIYEKGRQMGDPTSEWVRFEAEFKASTRRELPLDLLGDPARYLLGHYPVLRFIDAIASRIAMTKEATAATWKSARRHLKRQYGATLAFIVQHTADDAALGGVIRSLTSPKLPAWACKAAADEWPEIVAENQRETEQ